MELMPNIDYWSEPWVGGLMLSEGASECGTKFEVTTDTYPYPVKYAVNDASDIDTLQLQPDGFLGKYIETVGLVQDHWPDLLTPPVVPCAWTLGTFLRGADRIIQDFILYKSYIETESAARRRKLERRAEARGIDPLFWEREMEVYLELCHAVLDRHREAGTITFGTIAYDLYASPPNLDVDSYARYVYPYAQKTLKRLTFAPMGWQPVTPDEIREMKTVFKGVAVGNLGYEIDQHGHFNRVFDEDTILVAKECNTYVIMFISPDFLRDANESQVREYTSHLCKLAIEHNVPAIFSLVAIPAHTPGENVRGVIDTIQTEGIYR